MSEKATDMSEQTLGSLLEAFYEQQKAREAAELAPAVANWSPAKRDSVLAVIYQVPLPRT